VLAAALVVQTDRLAWADENSDFFEARIRPILVGTCFRCHGDAKTSGELRIDSRERLLTGGESGPAIIPGKPDESLLIRAIQRQEDVSAMPPEKDKALRADQIADFIAWVKAGAIWPEKSAKFEAVKHWAFEPVRDGATPEVQDKAWIKTSVDSFIRQKQEVAGVRPAPAADKLALIRRATFDLTGLPPTPAEVAAFVQDTSPAAFESVVERLLKSPAYGERWGRHWLDVVRYADTAGETADYPVPQAWQYRNYVIDAFNADKHYDEFLREQIAGDIRANQDPSERYAERVTATGYLAISRRFGFDSENYHHLTIQDTIDTLGHSVLGLSLGCARCHDHKFDALSMRDYYALYGIFDSSRYAFPGSEQKSKVRSLAPLVPPSEAQAKWREYEHRVAALASSLASQKQPMPTAVLRSLSDIDGDFELQAPAAGGSNGVLVPPWLYEGRIAVTAAAQSPFKNLHALGKVGASVPADAGPYRIAQAIHRAGDVLHVNLDFRVSAPDAAAKGVHRFALGVRDAAPAVEVLISAEALSLRQGETVEKLCDLKSNQWHNLQLILDLKGRSVSGRVGTPGEISEFAGKRFAADAAGVIDSVVFSSIGEQDARYPAIEFDNLGVQGAPLAPVSTEPPQQRTTADPTDDPVALTQQLQALTGIDGDFELQTNAQPPAAPWNPGPNSVVALSAKSQSPYQNIFAAGDLGMHMPNRGEYDGFGLTLPTAKPDASGRLFAAFDFCCASQDAGGDGSWRYYLGHGPGNSAAVELFFNGKEFFRRSGDAREAVGPIAIGRWYQVQVALDLKGKTYSGTLAWSEGKTDFSGQLATGWDGAIDYSFIDSYGHIGGVRPALDADNFAVGDKPLPALDAMPVKVAASSLAERRTKAAELREQLAAMKSNIESQKRELDQLLAAGPFALAYGMAEGTPHNVRMQLRGEPDQPGDEVPRGFIKALGGGPLAAETAGSGRLELAQWLTRPENPLTARVMVNRIWQYHFGRGIVQTPNDFGVRGLPPTHPELLDHLATQFIRGGWSIKAMHRLIMLSATYQQATDSSATAAPLDLCASFARRRLSAEEIRDAILVVSGELDATSGREHPFPSPIGWGYSQHGPFSAVYDHNRRSVYLMTQRLKRHPFLALFDGPDPNATTALRLATTVPTQALFFLNDPFIHAKAEKWAQRLLAASADEQQQVDRAWLRAIGREPTESERAEATEFLAAYRTELAITHPDNAEGRALAAYLRTLIGSNEFLHVD
jgi:hypothetical protein